jgi:hypothetical protein
MGRVLDRLRDCKLSVAISNHREVKVAQIFIPALNRLRDKVGAIYCIVLILIFFSLTDTTPQLPIEDFIIAVVMRNGRLAGVEEIFASQFLLEGNHEWCLVKALHPSLVDKAITFVVDRAKLDYELVFEVELAGNEVACHWVSLHKASLDAHPGVVRRQGF